MEQKSLTLRECLIGDRTFYRHVAVVVLPIIVQNTLSNVVSLLDNVMVGQVGTLPMSAVAIINQLLFVFNLCIWGALAGAGIFGAQYYGQGNMEGVRQTLRMKLLIAVGLLVIAFGVLLGAGRPLIELYISADTTAADAAATMEYALGYLRVMLADSLCADSGLRQHPAGIRPDNASHARQHDCHGHQLCVQQPVDLWPVRLSCFGRSGCRYCHFAQPLCGVCHRGQRGAPQCRALPVHGRRVPQFPH